MYKGISWAQTQCKPILQQPDFLVDLQSLRWTNFPWTESSFLRGQLDQTAGLRGLACTFAPGIPSGLMISRGSPKKNMFFQSDKVQCLEHTGTIVGQT
jgi:hypothetical protein